MPFSLTNTHALFQEIMHTILKDMEGYIWYDVNIHIYVGNSDVENPDTVKKVQYQYINHGLAGNLLKRKLYTHKIIFVKASVRNLQ